MKKKENIYFLFLGIFLSFILILAIFVKLVLYIHNDGIKQGMGINIANSEEILNIVEKNCGSTYFTHKWDDKKTWYVFVNVDYIPLEKCLQ